MVRTAFMLLRSKMDVFVVLGWKTTCFRDTNGQKLSCVINEKRTQLQFCKPINNHSKN